MSDHRTAGATAQEIEIVHINVGQGDATLILGPQPSSGNRVPILFDAGNIRDPDGGERVAAALANRNIRVLDYTAIRETGGTLRLGS